MHWNLPNNATPHFPGLKQQLGRLKFNWVLLIVKKPHSHVLTLFYSSQQLKYYLQIWFRIHDISFTISYSRHWYTMAQLHSSIKAPTLKTGLL